MFLITGTFSASAKKVYSAKTGNFNAQQTWTGGAVPSSGDTIIINHSVSISQAFTIGYQGVGEILVNAGGSLTGNTTLTVSDKASLINKGTLSLKTVTLSTATAAVSNSGTASFSKATVFAGTVSNNGTLNANANLTVSGTLTNSSTISVSGNFSNSSTVINSGSISVGGDVQNSGTITNSGTVIIAGSFTNTSSGTLNGTGGELDVQLQSTNYGTISGTSTFCDKSISDTGVVDQNFGTISGTITPCATSTITALPVELLSFTATTEANAVILDWTTVSEINNSHFDVEKSTDGIHFSTIGQVKGNGNTQYRIDYSYADNAASGKIYYRLRQVDFNGAYAYSKIVVVASEVSSASLNVYPNPAQYNSSLRISLSGSLNQVVNILLTDMSGRILNTVQKKTETANEIFTMDLSGLQPGMYVLKVISNGITMSEKLQISK